LTNLLKVSQLSVQFQQAKNRVLAVDNVSFDVPSVPYTIGLVGESGSGKSTLAMSIMNLIEPPGKITSGRVEFEGNDVLGMKPDELRRFRWEQVSMIYQAAMNSLNPVKTVIDPIVEVLVEHQGLSKTKARERAVELLSEVEIGAERAFDYPHEFSGGMRQRVVIALAMALSPKLLIADEPTSALDVVTQRQVLALLRKEVIRRGLSFVFITHEIALLRGFVRDVAVMYAGEIVERGPEGMVLTEPMHPYTEDLVGSVLSKTTRLDVGSDRGPGQKESMARPSNRGCRYASRCKYAFERCANEAPVLTEIKDGWWVSCHKYK
jgi:oligopeptide/dipeptide ABC transporter ATP-binding protein